MEADEECIIWKIFGFLPQCWEHATERAESSVKTISHHCDRFNQKTQVSEKKTKEKMTQQMQSSFWSILLLVGRMAGGESCTWSLLLWHNKTGVLTATEELPSNGTPGHYPVTHCRFPAWEHNTGLKDNPSTTRTPLLWEPSAQLSCACLLAQTASDL